MTTVYLIRHATYDDMENGDSLDNPRLSAAGVAQAERLRDHLARTGEIRADALISSPLRRAAETAAILAQALERPVTMEKELEEWQCDDGSLSPEEFNDRWQRLTEWQKPYYRWVPTGESWLELVARVQVTFNRLVEEYSGKSIVIVTHGEVIQAAYSYFLGLNPAMMPGILVDNTSIAEWSRRENSSRWTLQRYNDTRHLESPL